MSMLGFTRGIGKIGTFMKVPGAASMLGTAMALTTHPVMLAAGGLRSFNKYVLPHIASVGKADMTKMGYGKRGLDGNNLSTNGLVQSLHRSRRK